MISHDDIQGRQNAVRSPGRRKKNNNDYRRIVGGNRGRPYGDCDGFFERNDLLKREWGSHYLDLISKVIDENRMVPVFTPTHKFISQDCRHFTKAGAKNYAELFESELQGIFDSF